MECAFSQHVVSTLNSSGSLMCSHTSLMSLCIVHSLCTQATVGLLITSTKDKKHTANFHEIMERSVDPDQAADPRISFTFFFISFCFN